MANIVKCIILLRREIIFAQEDKKMLDKISLILIITGALNWGSVGIFRFDFVSWLFGSQSATFSRILYTLVGLAGIWCVSLLFRNRSAVLNDEI